MLTSGWKTATIATGGTVSSEVDLGSTFANVTVLVPAIDSATLALSIAEKSGGTFYPTHLLKEAGGSQALLTTASTGSLSLTFRTFGCQFIKLTAGAAQTSGAVAILVRGF